MTLRRVGLSNSLSTQAKITNRRFTLSRVSLRRFPFPTAAAAAAVVNYVEDVFSTYLYTGTGATRTITNNIDLSTYGGMVWTKGRNYVVPAAIFDTVRGANKVLRTNSTNAQASPTDALTGFTSSGYTLGADVSDWGVNYSPSYTYASWTFRKQAKFFDVVTYTGNGTAGRTVSHNLGSTPGCIIIKRTDSSLNWYVYHRYDPTKYLVLNQTAPAATFAVVTATSDTTFTLPNDGSTNGSGATYVAYLFAHNAGGFGATGSDNVISCGSYTGNGSSTGPVVNLGYEPQWLLVKHAGGGATNAGQWWIQDNMRGLGGSGSTGAPLWAESTNSESAIGSADWMEIGATYFQPKNSFYGINESGATYIYIAIRRGPMKTPTSGTSVFNTILRDGTGTQTSYTGVGFSPDAIWGKVRGNAFARPVISSRLTNTLYALYTDLTNAESSIDAYMSFNMDGFTMGSGTTLNTTLAGGYYYVHHCFKRAPGFFDIVCYTGTGTNTTITHNLTVVPELMIVKRRDASATWRVYVSPLGNTNFLNLNDNSGTAAVSTFWNNTTPTASVFTLGTNVGVNASGGTYIAYLFATLTGVSKVGSYTGTGTTLQVNCGFTAGARYVFIKRTDTNGEWYVWDSTRGIVAGNDPYLLINSLAAEVTNTDYIDTYSSGFEISSTAPAEINANGGTYIFLAIA